MSRGHTHQQPAGGPNDGAFDWFRVLDVIIWVSVILIAVLALEWFTGLVVREKIARGADKFRAQVTARKGGEAPAE